MKNRELVDYEIFFSRIRNIMSHVETYLKEKNVVNLEICVQSVQYVLNDISSTESNIDFSKQKEKCDYPDCDGQDSECKIKDCPWFEEVEHEP